MTCLPDVNVWMTLTVPEHVHHAAADAWYTRARYDWIVFSRITQMGFLRLLSDPKVMGARAQTPAEAWKTYDAWLQQDRIGYAAEPGEIDTGWRNISTAWGANSWTDAYLAAFASSSGYTLVTFDRQLGRRGESHVELLVL